MDHNKGEVQDRLVVCVLEWHMVSVRTFGAMYDHTFSDLQIIKSDIRPQIKWAVNLVIACGHFNVIQGFAWVHMG